MSDSSPPGRSEANGAPIPDRAIRQAVCRALAEDIGPGDITTESVIPVDARLQAVVVYREPAVVAGLPVAREVFGQLGAAEALDEAVLDGVSVGAGAVAAVVEAPARVILSAERVALNFLQRLSGIATLTRAYVCAVAGTRAQILDTRKTTPTLRAIEKYAVAVGGGTNHRMGLYDAVLIKDNHIACVADLATAVGRARAAAPAGVRLQVEVERLEDVEAAIASGADALLLDNMPVEMVRRAVASARGRVSLEASGRMTLENVRAYAETGVDFISVGALTHSAPAIDIGLDVQAWT